MAYLVDASILIEAKQRYYRFGLAPGRWFWPLLVRANGAGLVASAHHMRGEMLPAEDELTEWAKARGPEFWLPEDGATVQAMRDLANWAQGRANAGEIRQGAVTTFASGDIYLVATAIAGGHTVVTAEVPAPRSKKEIKMPDACAAFGVPWTDQFTMLEDLERRLG
jgi:hypothetical protein